MIAVTLSDWQFAQAEAGAIRSTVFIDEQGVPVELEWDEMDEHSIHALARDEKGLVIGTGRLLPDGHIGRMAVLSAYRGKGVGTGILTALLNYARQRGDKRIVLHAQTHAERFYRRCGFHPIGPAFMEAGIPHVEMECRLWA